MKKIEGRGFIISDCVMVWINLLKNGMFCNKMVYMLEPFLSEFNNTNGYVYLSYENKKKIFDDGILPELNIKNIYREDSGKMGISFIFNLGGNNYLHNSNIKNINMTEQKQNTTLYDYKQIDNYYYKIPKNNLVCFNNAKDKDKYIKICLWFQGLHDTRTIIIQNILTLLRLDYDGYEKIEI
jgi:hypothetical protein